MITSLLEQTASRFPGQEAVIDGTTRLTFRDLYLRKCVFAEGLDALPASGSPGPVALSLPNCWAFAVSLFALFERGVPVVPLNPLWKNRELHWCWQKLRFSAVITRRDLQNSWLSMGFPKNRLVLVDAPPVNSLLEGEGPCRHDRGASSSRRILEDQDAVYLMTSGSTGYPKIVPRSHRNLTCGARNVASLFNGLAGKRFLSVVPFHHANGLANCLLLPLLHGATTVMMDRFLPSPLIDTVAQEKIQILIASPFVFSMLAEQNHAPALYDSLETCLSSGAAMSSGLIRRCSAKMGLRVRQLYGSTETGTISMEPDNAPFDSPSVGLPVPGVEVRIDSGTAAGKGADNSGEIMVRSPAMMKGYLGADEENSRLFKEGFFCTGDLGHFDSYENLVVLGRRKKVLNVSGIKVDPVEIEQILRRIPSVRDCQVSPALSNRQLEIIKAVILVAPGTPLTREQVVNHCREHLAEYKIPRIIEIVVPAPQDAAGKSVIAWKENPDGFPGS
jgi:long-chain acyl-CoA synthetase